MFIYVAIKTQKFGTSMDGGWEGDKEVTMELISIFVFTTDSRIPLFPKSEISCL